MNITKNQLIAGYPAIQVRNFLRKFGGLNIRAVFVQRILHVDFAQADVFLREMAQLGYLQHKEDLRGEEEQTYEVTSSGLRLANASATQPISRKTAERVLGEFMNRLHEINASAKDPYAYKITSAVLFGSMLSDKEQLGDVDIAIELHPTTSDDKKLNTLGRYRLRMAKLNGKHFKSDFDQIVWPMTEVFYVLKAHSRRLSLHQLSELSEMQNVSYRVLYGDPVRLRTMLPEGVPK